MPDRLGPYQIAVLQAHPAGRPLVATTPRPRLGPAAHTLAQHDAILRRALDEVGKEAGDPDGPASALTGIADELEKKLAAGEDREARKALRWVRMASLTVWVPDPDWMRLSA